jgi:hypothetical protein
VEASTRLSITAKGEDELKHRLYKLSIRKRSVLVSLETPHTVAQVVERSVFQEDEILDEIRTLTGEGFVTMEGAEAAPRHGDQQRGRFELNDAIVLSEAKYLLIDFCVDSFGTHAQTFADGIRVCKTAESLAKSLETLAKAAEKQCPDRLPALFKIIQEINETAEQA